MAASSHRRYARVDRIDKVLRQVVADELERLADTDDRVGLLTVTAVQTDPDLRRATVLLASLAEPAKEALGEARVPFQAAIARQMRMKRTPLLTFAVDPAIISGNRVEDLLRTIPPVEDVDEEPPDDEAIDEDGAGA
jgi:ribosome-binding factor A